MDERTDKTDDVGASHMNTDADPMMIAVDLEATRDEMTETPGTAQERLDPERLSQQAVSTATEVSEQAVTAATEITEQAKEAAKEVVKYVIDEAKAAVNELTGQAKTSVRDATIGTVEQTAMQTRDMTQSVTRDLWSKIAQNPVPAGLAVAGLGWLWLNRSGGSRRTGYARYGREHVGMPSSWSSRPFNVESPSYGSSGPRSGYGSYGTQSDYGSYGPQSGQYGESGGQGQLMGRQMQYQMQERADQRQQMMRAQANPVAVQPLGLVAIQPGLTVPVVRVTLAPGAGLPPHTSPALAVAQVESGQVNYLIITGTANRARLRFLVPSRTPEAAMGAPVTNGAPAVGAVQAFAMVNEELVIVGEETRLGPGEGVAFGPDVVHTFRNTGSEPAVLLLVGEFPPDQSALLFVEGETRATSAGMPAT